MSEAVGSIHRAMAADTDLVRIIAENIANAQTAGYQRKLGVQHSEFSSIAALLATDAPSNLAFTTVADTSAGTLAETREPLDIALSGAGSLVVSTSRGEELIRGGRMRVDNQGQLVTQKGDPVLGTSGVIRFTGAALDPNSISISSDGAIREGGNVIGQLRVEPPAGVEEAATPSVLQGFVEGSNVEPVTEMIKLMEVMRHFEATQKVARAYGELMQQGISDLGKI